MAEFHLHHINVNVDNLDLAVAFYRDIVGLPLDSTPDQKFRSQFFRIGESQQIHMNELEDVHQHRGHFCLAVPCFEDVFRRAKTAGVIDLTVWGRVRQLPNGVMQMFLRDPSGNLVEIASRKGVAIDPEVLADELVEPERGMYRMEPGAAFGAHEPA
ncbi:MAG: VOC family protein [Planctomycetota bacterium]|nr:VOC family protein [Planctomycetota bacterium]